VGKQHETARPGRYDQFTTQGMGADQDLQLDHDNAVATLILKGRRPRHWLTWRKCTRRVEGEMRVIAPTGSAAMFERKLTAGDVCIRIVSVAYPELSIDEAARVMRDQQVGSLVVVEERNAAARQVVGILTDRDIVTQVVAAQKDPQTMRVADVMSSAVVTAREDDTVLELLGAMQRKGVRRVPVLGAGDRLVGVAAIDDVLAVIADAMGALAGAVGAARRHEQTTPGTTLSKP
jgi:CBS domain-containing protein